MSQTEIVGKWILSSMGRPNGRRYRPSNVQFIEIEADGRWRHWRGGGVNLGHWQHEGDSLLIKEEFASPRHMRVLESTLELKEEDEEHGGYLVHTYVRLPPLDFSDLSLRARKNRSRVSELAAGEGWVARAFREGRVDVLDLALGYGVLVYLCDYIHLDECPPAALDSILARLESSSDVVSGLATTNGMVLSAAVKRPTLAARAVEILSEILHHLPHQGRTGSMQALLAVIDDANQVGPDGVPLLLLSVLHAPVGWTESLLSKGASAKRACEQDVVLVGSFGRLPVERGQDTRTVALAAAAQAENTARAYMDRNPGRASDVAWQLASAERIRAALSRCL